MHGLSPKCNIYTCLSGAIVNTGGFEGANMIAVQEHLSLRGDEEQIEDEVCSLLMTGGR